jgi:PAS domain S-box-containing protein
VNADTGFDLYFPGEYLKAALVVSLLSVCVLIGVFYYLNYYTKRRYFTTWTAAWLFYAVWLTLCISLQKSPESPLLLMLKQWCVGVSAVFLLWGAARFLNQQAPQKLYALFIAFLLTWSYIGAYHLNDSLQTQLPIFGLIGLASIFTSWSFFQFRRRMDYIGAGLLAFGFGLWGCYMIAYPFLQGSPQFETGGFFISAVLQLFIAVSMIILVLEEVRKTNDTAIAEIRSHKSEKAVLESKVMSTEERYRSLFDQASEGIIITSAEDLKILELNQTARRLLGVNGGESRTQPLSQFCQWSDMESAPKSGEAWFSAICERRRFNLERKDGGVTTVELDGAPISFEGRTAYQFFFREQTEQARLEQQLRQAEKLSALGQMISGIAHELNNPLAVIKGYLELILAKHELSPQTRKDLEKVASEGGRAAKLVSNFLSFAREQPAHREMVDLNRLVEQVIEVRKYDARVVNVEVDLQLQAGIPRVHADPDQIQQVLVNLVNNSIQALAEQPLPHRLSVSTRCDADLIQILVADNGPGVPEHLVARIFEPFFTTKDVGTGTGLGLSIAHSILADHQGRIFYQRAEGGGACFVLELPVKDEVPEAAGAGVRAETLTKAPVAAPLSARAAMTAHILILDDEKSIAELLGEMLVILGYKTTLCHSAPHALKLIEQNHFDLVLSDFRMPQMDGQQFYREVVKQQPSLAPRIIFLTGDLVSEDTQSFMHSIGNRYLAKPFQLAKVEQAVTQTLQESMKA